MKPTHIPFIINGVGIALVLATISFLPPVVPLLYGRAIGENQLVPTIYLTLPSAVAILITFSNIILAKRLTKDNFLKSVLNSASVLVSVLALITTVRIILLVGLF